MSRFELPDEVRDHVRHSAAAAHWDGIGLRRRLGVSVPLFSLRGRRDCGIGDVGDLYGLVDWCRRIGAEVIQILPVNDLGLDSVPYSALSAYALDPVYLALDRVAAIARDAQLSARLEALQRRLATGERVVWATVRREKMALLEEGFRRAYTPALREKLDRFATANPWLQDYLPYRVIKETEAYASWETWGHKYADEDTVARFVHDHDARIAFHLYLQWLLEAQFRELREYANRQGVLIKGDIPILVSRDSADVWRHPEYFRLDTTAGAPPDMYSEDGQVWSFPTYNWDALARADYGWWRQRLRYSEAFFDLYRIDHVVGFFRIWTVRFGAQTAREGWFEPWDESQWEAHGRRLLGMMLESSRMLPLAEDLGTVPPMARHVLTDMGICGMKVQRWEKFWDTSGEFIQPAHYPPLSVATVSTHDSETLAGWWEAFPHERKQLYRVLGHTSKVPEKLTPRLHKQVLNWVADGSALFNLFMLQEFLQPFGHLPGDPKSHRVNVPGTVGDHNWTWRCPVTMEALLADDDLAEGIRRLFPMF